MVCYFCLEFRIFPGETQSKTSLGIEMWSTNVMILLLFCYACLSTGNGRVYFVSKDFYNVLHWDPVEPAFPGQEVLYTVEYLSVAQDHTYHIKNECHNIPDLFCDLTEETPSLHDAYYVAKVSINRSSIGFTKRFRPLAETNFSRPILSTHTTASTLHVNVALPTGPKGVPLSDIIAQSKNVIHRTIPLYTLHITEPKWAARVINSKSETFVINIKNNQTEYCGYVVYKPSTDWGRPASEKGSFCVTLKDNSRMLWQGLLVSTAALGAVIISIVCVCRYVKGGKSKDIPQALKMLSGIHTVESFSDKNLIISKIAQGSQADPIIYAKIQAMAKVSSTRSDGYSPQDIPCQAWHDDFGSSMSSGAHNATSHVVDTSAQSSENYGAVATHIPADEEVNCPQATAEHRETSQPGAASGESWDKGGVRPQLNSHEAPLVPRINSYESHSARPLLLNTVRDNKGQLMLPSFPFQFQSVSGDDESEKLLLSDLIYSMDEPSVASLQRLDSSDSGCDDCSVNTPTNQYLNSHYHQSKPHFPQGCPGTQPNNAVFESGYSKQQNWILEALDRHGSIDCNEDRRTNCPRTASEMEGESEEAEEDDGRGRQEKFNQILLGKWNVQIPE